MEYSTGFKIGRDKRSVGPILEEKYQGFLQNASSFNNFKDTQIFRAKRNAFAVAGVGVNIISTIAKLIQKQLQHRDEMKSLDNISKLITQGNLKIEDVNSNVLELMESNEIIISMINDYKESLEKTNTAIKNIEEKNDHQDWRLNYLEKTTEELRNETRIHNQNQDMRLEALENYDQVVMILLTIDGLTDICFDIVDSIENILSLSEEGKPSTHMFPASSLKSKFRGLADNYDNKRFGLFGHGEVQKMYGLATTSTYMDSTKFVSIMFVPLISSQSDFHLIGLGILW